MTSTASDASPRLRWIDGTRGIAIVLVVYGHAERALFAGPAVPAWAAATDRTIYAFHMPLFFVLAGLFVWPSLARGRARFARDKLVTIVYPYFLWSLIEGGLEVLFAGEVNTPLALRDLLLVPLVPIEQFWFLYVLALCFALALACYPRRWATAAAAVAGLAVVGRYGAVSMLLRTLAFFPYLAVGIMAAAPIMAIGGGPGRAAAVTIAGATAFAIGMAAGWGGIGGVVAVALAGCAMAAGAAALLDRGAAGAALALLGRGSLAIYVMHTIFSAGARIVTHLAPVAVPAWMVLAITTLVGVVGPLGVWQVAERLGVTVPMGLGRPTRRPRHASRTS